jgi:hypothetical protein
MKMILFAAASLLVAAPAFAYCPPPMPGDNGPPGRPLGYYVGSDCASQAWAHSGSKVESGSWASLFQNGNTASAAAPVSSAN